MKTVEKIGGIKNKLGNITRSQRRIAPILEFQLKQRTEDDGSASTSLPPLSTKMKVSNLLSHDHESMDRLLDKLRLALGKQDTSQAFNLLDLFWARLAVHIRAENICLFPALLSAPDALFSPENGMPSKEQASEMIAGLREDHNFFMDKLSGAMKAFRLLLSDPTDEPRSMGQIDEAIRTVSERMVRHNNVEESLMYLWPVKLFPPERLLQLASSVDHELQNLPPRFSDSVQPYPPEMK